MFRAAASNTPGFGEEMPATDDPDPVMSVGEQGAKDLTESIRLPGLDRKHLLLRTDTWLRDVYRKTILV